ncbi:uncharacterized protein SCHCODRAFT_02080460 [Schizophyllum commune H4-8]|uniref:uncharacterized protein n=1 Tax=Schizophyllum commune (strain H4-8 / FGSC 9210) TaxID=578458 RepID=UPI00215F268D|nr:uncharacterized protein SCHCODRAFT_02080460 [Schizophyllum commune H4-8]KAI5886756.1 hypothetical protein SCHCODRAFT_02080460 [Schizophyllum commune H4-8]
MYKAIRELYGAIRAMYRALPDMYRAIRVSTPLSHPSPSFITLPPPPSFTTLPPPRSPALSSTYSPSHPLPRSLPTPSSTTTLFLVPLILPSSLHSPPFPASTTLFLAPLILPSPSAAPSRRVDPPTPSIPSPPHIATSRDEEGSPHRAPPCRASPRVESDAKKRAHDARTESKRGRRDVRNDARVEPRIEEGSAQAPHRVVHRTPLRRGGGIPPPRRVESDRSTSPSPLAASSSPTPSPPHPPSRRVDPHPASSLYLSLGGVRTDRGKTDGSWQKLTLRRSLSPSFTSPFPGYPPLPPSFTSPFPPSCLRLG